MMIKKLLALIKNLFKTDCHKKWPDSPEDYHD